MKESGGNVGQRVKNVVLKSDCGEGEEPNESEVAGWRN